MLRDVEVPQFKLVMAINGEMSCSDTVEMSRKSEVDLEEKGTTGSMSDLG